MAQTAMNQTGTNRQIDKKRGREPDPVAVTKKTGGWFRKIVRFLKIILIILILIALLGLALAGVIRYQLVDLEQLDARWGFSKYPLVSQTVNRIASGELPFRADPVAEIEPSLPIEPPPAPPAAEVLPKPLPRIPTAPIARIDDAELKKQVEIQLEAEKKRLAKVARLYDGMKAEEAAPILNELDDATVILIFSKMEEEQIAKILTLLEPSRSARLSEAMLKGRTNS